ncbi:hypothetical protein GGR50DRAFT_160760 [Xylaria sp. CBS 124048]|nr:hypothetical protein GGR50DRAFT_160760 [Xylaria sp. CBS 124048]
MMAGWVVGGTEMLRSFSDSAIPLANNYGDLAPRPVKKRQRSHACHVDIVDDCQIPREWKRPRDLTSSYSHTDSHYDTPPTPAFFIIKETPRSIRVNESGICRHDQFACRDSTRAPILSDAHCHDLRASNGQESPIRRMPESGGNIEHDKAARLVEEDMADYRRRRKLSQHERILKSLISPKPLSGEFEIDDEALQGIFYAANELFFRGRLKGRVVWTWDDLPTDLIGTTAWRDAPNRQGYETMIYLSRSILKNKKYNRRLLISTFIHELIHSYLFVYCGYRPDDCGGHTSGFKRIADLINDWVGERNLLQLHKMEAELSDFEIRTSHTSRRGYGSSGCQVQRLGDGTLGYAVPRLRSQNQDPGGWR